MAARLAHIGVLYPHVRVTLRLEDWMSERRESLTVLAAAATNRLDTGETRSALGKVDIVASAAFRFRFPSLHP